MVRCPESTKRALCKLWICALSPSKMEGIFQLVRVKTQALVLKLPPGSGSLQYGYTRTIC